MKTTEHSARLQDPSKFDRNTFRRTTGGTIFGKVKIPATVSVIWGKLAASDSMVPQALRFNLASWTVASAQAWLKEQAIECLEFEVAEPKVRSAQGGGSFDSFLLCSAAPVEWIEAAAGGDEPALARFSIVAYTGDIMSLSGWLEPVVIDIAGMEIPAGPIPALRQHDPEQIVGHGEGSKTKTQIKVKGLVSGVGAAAVEVVASSKNGFPWKASVGAMPKNYEFIREGATGKANGRSWKGPCYIITRSLLGEVSFVPIAADSATSVKVAAEAAQRKEMIMDFEKWVEAKGFDVKTLSDEQKTSLEAAYKAETEAKDPAGAIPPVVIPDTPAPPVVAAGDPANEVVLAVRAAAAAETTRIAAIHKLCGEGHADIEAKAIAGNWDETKVELEMLKAERPKAVPPRASAASATPLVLEAALCMAGGLADVEKQFDEPTLEAAHTQYREGMGLQELLLVAARANGYSGQQVVRGGNLREIMERAFPIRAAQWSTVTISGLLSNTANKFLLAGFDGVEDVWRRLASITPVNDFKAITSYRLTGDLTYEEVGAGGELPHGTLNEESLTNQAATYGKMMSITRTDIINDDLGALSSIPKRLGRGAALKVNDVFWTEFLDNSSFFTAGRGNYAEGSGTALTAVNGVTALTAAELLFLNQTDPDGDPLGSTPKTLLVPNALNVVASQLMRSTDLGRDDEGPVSNPHAGKFNVERSSYLSNANITGYSALAWYLLSDPADLPTIELVFLHGKQVPTVESADADFNVLGIQMRGFHDFGAAKQEYRAAIKMKGEA